MPSRKSLLAFRGRLPAPVPQTWPFGLGFLVCKMGGWGIGTRLLNFFPSIHVSKETASHSVHKGDKELFFPTVPSAVPWLLWFVCRGEAAASGNELPLLLFSIWSPFLASLSSLLTTSVPGCLVSVLFSPREPVKERAAGELAFSLVGVVMRQGEDARQAQAVRGDGAGCTGYG